MTEGNVNKYKKNKFDSAPQNGGTEERYSELGKKSTPDPEKIIICLLPFGPSNLRVAMGVKVHRYI